MKINMELTSSSRALKAINRLAELGENTEPVLNIVGSRLLNRVRLSFKGAVDPYGKPWAKITHRKGQPLSDNRILRGSMDFKVTREADADVLEIGTNTVYARLHQFGGQGKKAQVPAFTRIQTFAWGKKIAPRPVKVKAHTRTMNQKARPFLPVPEKGLPPSWDLSASRAILKALGDSMKG